MRIASGGITHETNTFATRPTTLDDFIRDSGGDPTFPPQRIVEHYANSATIHGGYLVAAERRGVTLQPLLLAAATPGGIVQESAYQHLKLLGLW